MRLTLDDAVRLALGQKDGVLAKLAEEHPVLLYRFGVTAGESASYIEPIWEGGVEGGAARAETLNSEGLRDALGDLKAEGRYTDLGRAVRETLNRLEGRRLAALVVLSDGRNTALEKARLAGADVYVPRPVTTELLSRALRLSPRPAGPELGRRPGRG